MEASGTGKRILFAVVAISLMANVAMVAKYVGLRNDVSVNERALASYRYNDKVLAFMKFFIEKVLESKTEVGFEDRLQLENQVRDLKDPEIASAWNLFTSAQTELEAQDAVKKLLKLFAEKISIR